MTTKNQELYYVKNNLHSAISHLEAVKKMDIKNRKNAKASRKPKWTQSIKQIDKTLEALQIARIYFRQIHRRV